MEVNRFNQSDRHLNIITGFLVGFFLIGWILGIRGPVFIVNYKCYAFLGCNMGFFGYDAALHFVSGLMDVALLLWLVRKFPALNIFQERFWKNFLIIVHYTKRLLRTKKGKLLLRVISFPITK